MSTLIKPGSADWLRLVTASKVSAILGLSPWESPRSLWHKMRGDIAAGEQTSVQARGSHLEAGVLNWFFADHPELSRHGGEVTVTRDDLPWAAATPDDIATGPDGVSVPVDAKTDGRGDAWGEAGTDQVPLHLACQAMWVMHLGKFDRFWFVRLGPFLDRDEFEVRYDPQLAADIEARCFAFWLSLADGVPPELDGTTATYEALRAVSSVGDGDWECPPELAHDLCRARAAVTDAEVRHNLARSTVLEAMGDAKRVVCAGQVVGQKQATRGGKPALYPPRKAVDIDALPILDTPQERAA